MSDFALCEICKWEGDCSELKAALIECRIIDVNGEDLTVHGWEEHNRQLIAGWNNTRSFQESGKKRLVKKAVTNDMDDQQFIEALKANKAYEHLNVEKEFARMDAWLLGRPDRKKTRRFIINWLNRASHTQAEVIVKSKSEAVPLKINSIAQADSVLAELRYKMEKLCVIRSPREGEAPVKHVPEANRREFDAIKKRIEQIKTLKMGLYEL